MLTAGKERFREASNKCDLWIIHSFITCVRARSFRTKMKNHENEALIAKDFLKNRSNNHVAECLETSFNTSTRMYVCLHMKKSREVGISHVATIPALVLRRRKIYTLYIFVTLYYIVSTILLLFNILSSCKYIVIWLICFSVPREGRAVVECRTTVVGSQAKRIGSYLFCQALYMTYTCTVWLV